MQLEGNFGGKLWHHENLAKLTTNQKFAKFSPSKFLHIYGKVCSIADAQLLNTLHEILPPLLMNIKQI